MITDALLSVVFGLLSWAGGMLPVWNPVDHVPPLGGAVPWLNDLDYFLPIHELISLVLAVLLLTPAFVVASLALWLIALVRGGSSRG